MVVFSVQDETGTVAQLTLSAAPAQPVALGDAGIYAGIPDDGTEGFAPAVFASLPFTVGQVLNTTQFSVTTKNANMADWPANGLITWMTGANAAATSTVTSIDGANAYVDPVFYKVYHQSRGNAIGTPTAALIQAAIVQGTDYLDQKYRFSGVKLLQRLGSSIIDANAVFLESWLTPYALNGQSYMVPSTTSQSTEWPRQGVIDFNGNTINGIPKVIKEATAQLAFRVLNGVVLQSDYDSKIVGNGGVVSSITKKVGPLETVTSYDTKLGLGFFASFPQIDRMLSRAGLLNSGGGRTLIR
jgi:hypothetical protein